MTEFTLDLPKGNGQSSRRSVTFLCGDFFFDNFEQLLLFSLGLKQNEIM